jgi:putative aldouronate transport system permease protein
MQKGNSAMREGRVMTKRTFRRNVFYENVSLWILALPTVVLLFIFNYIPMAGLVVAFKDYRYNLGLFGSQWIGFQNFEFFLNSLDAWRITRNTLLYGFTFIVVGIVFAVLISLLLYEVKNKFALKFFQTTMTIPRFLSWVIVSYITYLFLSPTQGVFNDLLTGFGFEPIMWFNEVEVWPFIIVLVNLWKSIGLDCIMYYALLMGIDSEQFEAAKIDGANRFQQALYISIPSLLPLMIILGILQLANIFRGDFGLFFQIPRDVGLLYPATDIIDTYVFRGLRGGDIGPAAAVGFFQSVVGLITVVIANAIVRKMSPSNALY